MPFAISKKTNSAGSIAVTNFDREIDETKLQSFSFLTVENILKYSQQIIAGVVRYDGVILNERPDLKIGFQVQKIGESNTIFGVDFAEAITGLPTVVVFPQWFTADSSVYPLTVSDVSCALDYESINSSGFEVAFGRTLHDRSYFGFNFLAIDPLVSTENVKHGLITQCIGSNYGTVSSLGNQTLHGLLDPVCHPSRAGISSSLLSGRGGGVLVTFDKPFRSLPSVIVSPVLPSYDSKNNTDQIQYDETGYSNVPRCTIESLTIHSAFVKCGRIRSTKEQNIEKEVYASVFAAEQYAAQHVDPIKTNETIEEEPLSYNYEWIPFTIVAVGESSDEPFATQPDPPIPKPTKQNALQSVSQNDFWAQYFWNDIDESEQENWKLLGWNSESWEFLEEAPLSAFKPWDDLTATEQEAARNLGYNSETPRFIENGDSSMNSQINSFSY